MNRSGLLKALRDDKEIQALRKQCHEVTGEWVSYHWECFKNFEEYKEYMRKKIEEKRKELNDNQN